MSSVEQLANTLLSLALSEGGTDLLEDPVIGSECEAKVIHFASTHINGVSTPDTSKIWVVIRIGEHKVFSGYIPNEFIITEIDKENLPIIKAVITSFYYSEHMNGGRRNINKYTSIQDYFADPLVKSLCKESFTLGMEYCFKYSGDPTQVDLNVTFDFGKGLLHELTDHMYETTELMPEEWYNEVHEATIEHLATVPVYDTVEEAISNVKSTDDLFGERYFPVITAPVHLKYELKNTADGFKGCSLVLSDDKNVYIGLRAKADELSYLEEVYELGGKVLHMDKAEWNW